MKIKINNQIYDIENARTYVVNGSDVLAHIAFTDYSVLEIASAFNQHDKSTPVEIMKDDGTIYPLTFESVVNTSRDISSPNGPDATLKLVQ